MPRFAVEPEYRYQRAGPGNQVDSPDILVLSSSHRSRTSNECSCRRMKMACSEPYRPPAKSASSAGYFLTSDRSWAKLSRTGSHTPSNSAIFSRGGGKSKRLGGLEPRTACPSQWSHRAGCSGLDTPLGPGQTSTKPGADPLLIDSGLSMHTSLMRKLSWYLSWIPSETSPACKPCRWGGFAQTFARARVYEPATCGNGAATTRVWGA